MKKIIFLTTLTALIITSCKKEIQPLAEKNLQAESSQAVQTAKPAIIVSAGGSIQAAVNAANPGSIIRIEPGVYNEAVVVNKADLQMIGTGDGVIIQNPGNAANGITVNDAGDGFVLKNVTVRNFGKNGVFLTHADNFLLSHVIAINNGEFGIYPVFSNGGVIQHCKASGHSDTGITVGQSNNVTMSFNAVYGNVQGLGVDNCTNITLTKNQCYNNTAGITVVFLPGLVNTILSNITVSNNHVNNNNLANFSDPGELENFVPSGTGILVIAGTQINVKDNKVSGNNTTGIAMISGFTMYSLTGNIQFVNAIDPVPHGNKVISNVLNNNGNAPAPIPLPAVDLLWDGPLWGGTAANVCWKSNNFSTSFPTSLPACN